MKNTNIDRAHKVNPKKKKKNVKKRENANNKKSGTIFLRLTNYEDKNLILSNSNKLKEKDTYINEGYRKETTELREELLKEITKHRKEGKNALLNHGLAVVRSKNEQK